MIGDNLSDRWRWAMIICLVLTLISRIQDFGKADEGTMRAIRDEGTERDPLYATKAPLDTLFCGATPSPLCERYETWKATSVCSEKWSTVVALRSALPTVEDGTLYARLLFATARVQVATEDTCGTAGAPSAFIRGDAGPPRVRTP